MAASLLPAVRSRRTGLGNSRTLDPRRGYDAAAESYRRPYDDPYETTAASERDLGRRFPDPYAAVAAEQRMLNELIARSPYGPTVPSAKIPLFVGAPEDTFTNMRPDNVVWNSHEVAGRRTTFEGTVGRVSPYASLERNTFNDARRYAAFKESGSRDGTSYEWHIAEMARRTSGLLTANGESFSQHVFKDRPVLILRARGGAARMAIRAGLTNGGAESLRTFIIGGGFTAQLRLAAWDNVRVQIIGIEAGSAIHFAWVEDCQQGGDQTLYVTEGLVAGQISRIPEGAYSVVLENQDNVWLWTVDPPDPQNPGGAAPGNMTVLIPANTPTPVLATQATPSINNDAVFFLRPM